MVRSAALLAEWTVHTPGCSRPPTPPHPPQRKAALAHEAAITDDVAGAAYVDNFALKVFVGADNEDRSGKATRATAKKFIAASNFLELLRLFEGEMKPEVGAVRKSDLDQTS